MEAVAESLLHRITLLSITETHRDTGAQPGPALVNTGRLTGPAEVGLEELELCELADIFLRLTGEEGALPAEEEE